jgi:hypothetical protein
MGGDGHAATPVIVKFSPPLTDRVGRRLADLLVAEHLAHVVLNDHGMNAARSEVLTHEDQVFLEVERFDRTRGGGRRSVLSLLALDAQFVGSCRSWTYTAERLEKLGHFNVETTQRIRWAQCFGRLIANTDMHFGNLAFFVRGTRVLGMAPLYDMLPTLYAPRAAHMPEVAFELAPVMASEADVWPEASAAAVDYWRRVSVDERVSSAFRATCQTNVAVVERWRGVARRSPWG